MGRSASVNAKSFKSAFFPSEHSPSHETNSVHITSGFPYLAMMRRNAASVTSAIGANIIIGRFNCFQNPVTIYPYSKRYLNKNETAPADGAGAWFYCRSEEHTSEL